MKSPLQELIDVFENREMSITDFYMHFLKERHNYLEKEKKYIDDLVNPKSDENTFNVYPEEFSIENAGKKITLPRKEFLLVKYFIENKNKVLRRSKILSEIWGDDIIVGERTVDVHIRKIKQKFSNAPIVTQKCVGYMWKEN